MTLPNQIPKPLAYSLNNLNSYPRPSFKKSTLALEITPCMTANLSDPELELLRCQYSPEDSFGAKVMMVAELHGQIIYSGNTL